MKCLLFKSLQTKYRSICAMVNYEFGKCFCATEDEAVTQSYDLRKPRLLVY